MTRIMKIYFSILFVFTSLIYAQDYSIHQLIYSDDFDQDLSNWVVEQTPDGNTRVQDSALEIEGGGCTIWFKEILNGPILIEYEATLIQKGGPHDNCRDLNCFWMARHPRAPYDLFNGWRSNSESRSGQFRNYHELRTYYVGMGGHRNTTTRFRRYTGHGDRPLLPQHDLTDSRYMLEPNKTYKISIVACNDIIQWKRDGEVIFDLRDPQPYQSGWFGFRSVSNHMKIDHFRVYKLQASQNIVQTNSEISRQLNLSKGLAELSTRSGWRDQNHFLNNDTYLSERTIFNDPETGCEIWRMSNDPAVESNEYTDIPVWSADGKLLMFVTSRNGKPERWLMDADGSNLRPLNSILDIPTGKGVWSTKYPDILYFVQKDTDQGEVTATHIMSGNVVNGEIKKIVSVQQDLGKMQPPHPSEELFLFGDHMGGAWKDKEHPSRAFVVNRKGKVSEISFDRLYHRLRFTKSPDGRIFYNFDKPRTSWTCLPDGSDRIEIPVNGGHPDWIEGGEWLIFNAREELPDGTKNFDLRYDAVRYNGSEIRTLYPYGGHASTCLDGSHIVCDGGPGAGSVNYVSIDSANTSQILFMNHTSRYDHSNTWHPKHHSTHPHSNSSPDGTKVLSNSDVIGQYSDIYVSIVRFPDPPLHPSAKVRGRSVLLNWEKPGRHHEVKGYYIYRSIQSGTGYECIVDKPISGTSWKGEKLSGDAYYVITAVEYSGLESRPSTEVYQAGNQKWQGPVRMMIEAETGKSTLPLEKKIAFDVASNGYYLTARSGVAGGESSYDLELPVDGDYFLWARSIGRGDLAFQMDDEDWGSIIGLDRYWGWQRIPFKKTLTEGRHHLTMIIGKGIEIIDQLMITNDPSFMPSGLMALDAAAPAPPNKLNSKSLSPNTVKLSWNASSSKDAAYYHVYASKSATFQCDQHSRIGSPVETEFVDWGLSLNTKYYYQITAVDRAGNESTPSDMISIRTESFVPVNIDMTSNRARLKNVDMVSVQQIGSMALSTNDDSKIIWDFQVPKEGDYAIWGESVLEKKGHDRFELLIDDTLSIHWDVYGLYNTWKWSPAGKKHSGSPQVFHLKEGDHRLTLIPLTENAKVSRMRITNDPSWWPVSEMKSTGY